MDHFSEISPWNEKYYIFEDESENIKLNISKLLEKDDEVTTNAGRKHSIVIDGFIDIFNLKVFAFLICRGQHKRKVDFMYDLIWQNKNARKKWPRITWT